MESGEWPKGGMTERCSFASTGLNRVIGRSREGPRCDTEGRNFATASDNIQARRSAKPSTVLSAEGSRPSASLGHFAGAKGGPFCQAQVPHWPLVTWVGEKRHVNLPTFQQVNAET